MNPEATRLFSALQARLASDPVLAPLNLLASARPSVRLIATREAQDELAPGQSRIGGVPDLPAGFEWPRWMPPTPTSDKFGEARRPETPPPLGFIAQLDLGAIPRIDEDMLASGWLYFFYDRHWEPWGFDPQDRGCCRVFHVEADRASLVRDLMPPDADPSHLAECCSIEPHVEWTLPNDVSGIVYDTPEYHAYTAVQEELCSEVGDTRHRLLGHPRSIQGSMELECQLASNGINCGSPEGYGSEAAKNLEAGASDWRLLLQIDTDEDGPDWMWGDGGSLYFWIRKRDLASRRFDDVWLVFQCY